MIIYVAIPFSEKKHDSLSVAHSVKAASIPPPTDEARTLAEARLRDAIGKVLDQYNDEFARRIKAGDKTLDTTQLERDLEHAIETQLAQTVYELSLIHI